MIHGRTNDRLWLHVGFPNIQVPITKPKPNQATSLKDASAYVSAAYVQISPVKPCSSSSVVCPGSVLDENIFFLGGGGLPFPHQKKTTEARSGMRRVASAECGTIEALKARSEVGYVDTCPLPSRLGDPGRIVSSPVSVRGTSPGGNAF